MKLSLSLTAMTKGERNLETKIAETNFSVQKHVFPLRFLHGVFLSVQELCAAGVQLRGRALAQLAQGSGPSSALGQKFTF